MFAAGGQHAAQIENLATSIVAGIVPGVPKHRHEDGILEFVVDNLRVRAGAVERAHVIGV